MSASCSTSPASATPGPFLRSLMDFVLSAWNLQRIFLTLRMMSVTSSVMPGIVENSCRTPSILTETTAAPDNEDSKTRRSELPTVVPNPRSNGSAAHRPAVAVQLTSAGAALLRPRHNRSHDITLHPLPPRHI